MAKEKDIGVKGLFSAFQGVGEGLNHSKGKNPFLDITSQAGQAFGGIIPTTQGKTNGRKTKYVRRRKK